MSPSMRLRVALVFLFLFGLARVCFAADAVSLKISHFGLEGNYAAPAEPTWVEVTAHNKTELQAALQLVVSESQFGK